jgi:Flp pilus assembly protein protease CpaA
MNYIPILINAAVLIYGGVIDYKRREIPNTVPVILVAVGVLFGFSIFYSIMGLALPAILLLAAGRMTKTEIPGGDYKLLCSLGFTCGLGELAAVTLLAAVGAVVCGFIRRLPVKRHIPLCSYVAPAYIVLQLAAIALSMKGGGSF